MIPLLRDPIWQGLSVFITIILGLIGFYYAGRNRAWLFAAGAIVILIAGVALGSVLAGNGKEICTAYLESNGQVVINANQYMQQIPGRAYLTHEDDPSRDATGIAWRKNADFSNTLQALPDLQSINTMDGTNGPALVYLIDFQTTGRYFVYIRGFGTSDDRDSIHIGLGAIPATADYVNGFSLFRDKSVPRWVGKSDMGEPVMLEVPNPGLNTLYIWMREAGVNVQRIWLDTGADKISNGDETEGPSISPCVNIASG